jgi:hypothetical protein
MASISFFSRCRSLSKFLDGGTHIDHRNWDNLSFCGDFQLPRLLTTFIFATRAGFN